MVNKLFTNLGLTLVLAAALALWPHERMAYFNLSSTIQTLNSTLSGTEPTQDVVPVLISSHDRGLYKQIFEAQQKNDWSKAKIMASEVKNPLLMGHVLAERYLSEKYKPTAKELNSWLDKYSDHPEAYAIYSLAVAKSADSKIKPEPVQKRKILTGYGTYSGDNIRFSGGKAPSWQMGLHAWRDGDKALAAKFFVAVSHANDLTPWQESAASYWAWRALDATGQKAEAKKYLRRAASKGHSFYSILARRQLGMDNSVSSETIALSETDILEMIGEPVVRRTIALARLGLTDRAENELRYAFPMADETGKMRLLALAHDLKLASVQISMAQQLKSRNRDLDAALYPVPHWQPANGFTVEPALIYALARQESGFQAKAVSPVGAKGIMQLMPKTASMMKKSLGITAEDHANDPVANVTLGQNYVRHLLDQNAVNNNLVYMLVAYNAGIARLIDWKKTTDQNDPLLFIESIPFGETRAYVMQVMTNYWIYSGLTGGSDRSIGVLARNLWPSHDAAFASKEMVDVNG